MTILHVDKPIEVGETIDGYLDHTGAMVWLPTPMRILDAGRAYVMAAVAGGPLVTFMSYEVRAVFDTDRTKTAIYLHRHDASQARWAQFPKPAAARPTEGVAA
ncbi:MAG: hypothetical protein R2710_25950 [Acidimicrobiales bacterium]